MRFAVGLPNVKEYADPRLLFDLAKEAESSGWDGVFLWDHLLYREPGDPVVDPWSVLPAIATSTERIRFGVMITALARRRPWNVARQAATIDHLSGGRLIFGAGLGSLREEFDRFGEDSDEATRAALLDEALTLITDLWTGREVSHEGEHYQVGPVRFTPAPSQSPRIPIWIAGRWPNRRPFRRAAAWDGIFATHRDVGHDETMSADQLEEIVRYVRAQREAANDFDIVIEGVTEGRDPAADGDMVASYAAAGLTWWVEKLGWFRGPLDQMRARIRNGPPEHG